MGYCFVNQFVIIEDIKLIVHSCSLKQGMVCNDLHSNGCYSCCIKLLNIPAG